MVDQGISDGSLDVPALTALYLGEACSCYVNGEYFATLAMCHAIIESFVKGAYRAAKRSMVKVVKEDGREKETEDMERFS